MAEDVVGGSLLDAGAGLLGMRRWVTYKRGDDFCRFQVTFSRSSLQVDDQEGGVRVVRTDGDILFHSSLLVLGTAPTAPQRGDRVEVDFGAETVAFEVLAPGSEDVYRYTDAGQTRYRVHLKKVGTVT